MHEYCTVSHLNSNDPDLYWLQPCRATSRRILSHAWLFAQICKTHLASFPQPVMSAPNLERALLQRLRQWTFDTSISDSSRCIIHMNRVFSGVFGLWAGDLVRQYFYIREALDSCASSRLHTWPRAAGTPPCGPGRFRVIRER